MKSFRLTHFFFLILTFIIASTAFATQNSNKALSTYEKLKTLESSFDGKIGVYAVDTSRNQQIHYRSSERFPIQSTFKVMVVADILNKSATHNYLLKQKIEYKKEDLIFWSPITEKNVNSGMTIAELCAAAIMHSDNTATNLIMKKLGGPAAVTAFARSIGDTTFRIDNWEPELNSNPNDLHDTSTPQAMGKSLRNLALGNILAPSQREELITWMRNNTTGNSKIRAGVPKGWIVADKTGAGNSYGISNDIAIVFPKKCAPIILAIYTVQNKKNSNPRDDIVASAANIVVDSFSQANSCIGKIR